MSWNTAHAEPRRLRPGSRSAARPSRTRLPIAVSREMLERATRECSTSPQIATVRPCEAALAPPDRQRVEQRLGRVLVRAVAGVDHRRIDLLRQQGRRAGGWSCRTTSRSQFIAFKVAAVSSSVSPLFTTEVDDRHVDHVGAQPLAGQLEAGAGAGAVLEKQIDQRAARAAGRAGVLPVRFSSTIGSPQGRASAAICGGYMPSIASRCLRGSPTSA